MPGLPTGNNGPGVSAQAQAVADMPQVQPAGSARAAADQQLSSATVARIAELEREMAVDCARCDIRSWCNGSVQDGKQWFVIKVRPCARMPEMQAIEQHGVNRAIEYLTLLGLIEVHPRQPWVHVKEAVDASA
jgi:hypothetical protein